MTQPQMTLSQAMDLARAHQQAGRLREAESICRQILAIQPQYIDALHALGGIAFLVGNFPASAEFFSRALQVNPADPALRCNLGQALAAAGKLEDAIAAYRQALAAHPDFVAGYNLLGDALDAQGKTDESIAAYQQAIARKSAEGHNNLGVVFQRIGSPEKAIAEFQEALSIRPDFPQAMNNLGECLRSIGRLDEAVNALRETVRIAPAFADAHHNLGLALREKKDYDAAVALFRQAIALRPDFAKAFSDLGETLRLKEEYDEAIATQQQAIRIAPDLAAAHANLGAALQSKGSFEQAIAAYRKALELQPDFPETWNNLGNALHAAKRSSEAVEAYNNAIAQRPNFADAYHNLGIALEKCDRLEEALDAYDQSIRRRPAFAETHNNRVSPLHALGRFEEAAAAVRQAIELKPDYMLAHYNLALTLLLLGRFDQAWPEHEWRLLNPELEKIYKDFKQPKWDGVDPRGKRILLYVEQGFGDTIHFIRYAPLLAERGAKVIVGCRPELARLLKSVDGIDQFIIDGDPLPEFDLHCSLLSLPYLFHHNSPESFPANIPYLKAEPELSEKWRQRLAPIGSRLRVGLVWAGGAAHANDRNRSVSLALLAPLAQAADVQFISLQKGPPADQLRDAPPGMNVLDFSDELNDFSDTAALIEHLDLVITVDTSVAHVAGAMGKPVWVLLAHVPDWRWMLDREDSPWYPTMQMFRQPKAGDWQVPIQQIVQALNALKP